MLEEALKELLPVQPARHCHHPSRSQRRELHAIQPPRLGRQSSNSYPQRRQWNERMTKHTERSGASCCDDGRGRVTQSTTSTCMNLGDNARFTRVRRKMANSTTLWHSSSQMVFAFDTYEHTISWCRASQGMYAHTAWVETPCRAATPLRWKGPEHVSCKSVVSVRVSAFGLRRNTRSRCHALEVEMFGAR
ncbi:hypothetical protein K402DRAFT_36804 [Aulographum hederae CBS 113979]|uniref:Uncharacterized protein n=1 Tax=Aulographum hederae CBS 113979 TaxID=1176131 RepID=A0A6G1H4P3_9PEZI|nr:hypothetical protein K402DRAFT_36804 [Aulographum hederae CBS 113979]